MQSKRKYSCPVACAILRNGPGKASNLIRQAKSEIKPGDKVVLCCRVSHCTQNHNGNLRDQEARLRRCMKKVGAVVMAVCTHVGSGVDKWSVLQAATEAREHGAKLVAESTDRFIRHEDYHSSKNPDAQARETDLEDLGYLTRGVTLSTLLHPDATPARVRSFQRKRGQWAKGHKGGRPLAKKKRREKLLPDVLRLHVTGKSCRAIAAMLGLPRSTVHRWSRHLE
jgi:DNA invertase Pin-like site-specific DNA recombinase